MKLYKPLLILFPLFFIVLGCDKGKESTTITVSGIGTMLAQPDTVQMNISLSHTDRTTRQAQEQVNIMVRQVLGILKDAGIDDKNISTSSLRFDSEYDWRGGRKVFLGQRVEQTIAFSVNDIKENAEKAPMILDQITQVNEIALNQVNFSIKDNTQLFIKSRELAYQKALDKAKQYAELSDLKIVKPLNISESGAPQISSRNNRLYQSNVYAQEMEYDSGSTILPTGELEITTQIVVTFLLE